MSLSINGFLANGCKVKVLVLAAPFGDGTAITANPFSKTALQTLAAQTGDPNFSVMDRGHRHTSGVSEVSLWFRPKAVSSASVLEACATMTSNATRDVSHSPATAAEPTRTSTGRHGSRKRVSFASVAPAPAAAEVPRAACPAEQGLALRGFHARVPPLRASCVVQRASVLAAVSGYRSVGGRVLGRATPDEDGRVRHRPDEQQSSAPCGRRLPSAHADAASGLSLGRHVHDDG